MRRYKFLSLYVLQYSLSRIPDTKQTSWANTTLSKLPESFFGAAFSAVCARRSHPQPGLAAPL
jgi:hypothetical protein